MSDARGFTVGELCDAVRPLRVGDMLHGFCGGEFGRDSYENKRVEAIGADWVVVRDDLGRVLLYDGVPDHLVRYTVAKPRSRGTMDPYCHDGCEVFHARGACDEIQERRATVTPINIHQLRLDDPKVLCRTCEYTFPGSEVNETGQCPTCASTLEELLAESLRRRGVSPI